MAHGPSISQSTAHPTRKGLRHTILGFKPTASSDLIARLERGLTVETMDRLMGEMELTPREMADFVQIAPRTLARRRRSGVLDLAESERILRLIMLLERAQKVLGTTERAREWLKRPKTALAGATPLAYARTEVGARDVEEMLGRIEHGVFG